MFLHDCYPRNLSCTWHSPLYQSNKHLHSYFCGRRQITRGSAAGFPKRTAQVRSDTCCCLDHRSLEPFEMFFLSPLSPLVQPVSAVMSGITAMPAQDSASARRTPSVRGATAALPTTGATTSPPDARYAIECFPGNSCKRNPNKMDHKKSLWNF